MTTDDKKPKNPTFFAADTEITLCDAASRKPKPLPGEKIPFGEIQSDHMAVVDFDSDNGWGRPKIVPFGDITISPCSSGLHYGFQVFEGIKAYRSVQDPDNIANIFRLDMHAERFLGSTLRMSMPAFDVKEMCELIKKLVSIDFDWIPRDKFSSLYIRPLIFATEPTFCINAPRKVKLIIFTGPVGSYLVDKKDVSDLEFKVKLLADPQFVRAWPGGAGAYKTGCNYGPTVAIQRHAEEKFNAGQVLWLYQNKITEIGTMNVFVSYMKDKKRILATPKLNDGIILAGLTRRTIIELCQKIDLVDEFVETDIFLDDIINLIRNNNENNKLLGFFGSGTAATICPINTLFLYKDENTFEEFSFPTDSTLCNQLIHLITSLQTCSPIDNLDKNYVDSLQHKTRKL